jgi:hypothetical protein
VSHLFVRRRSLTDFRHRSGAQCRAMPDATTVLGSPQLGCEEDLHTFDRSPVLCAHPAKKPSESPSDAAGLLMLLSAAPDEGDQEDNAPQDAPKAVAPEQLLSALAWQPPQPQHQQQDGEARPGPKRAAVKVDRVLRCGACEGCRRGDCGRCPNCRDKPKFGGAGVKKQACNHRRCLQPTRTGMGHREALRNAMAATATAADADSDASEAASHDSTISFYGSPQHFPRRDAADGATLPPVDEHQGWDDHKLPPAAAATARAVALSDAELVMAAAAGGSSSEDDRSRPSPGLWRETAGLQLVGKQARRTPAAPQPRSQRKRLQRLCAAVRRHVTRLVSQPLALASQSGSDVLEAEDPCPLERSDSDESAGNTHRAAPVRDPNRTQRPARARSALPARALCP